MSTRRRPARWTSTHRARRALHRQRWARRSLGPGPGDWVRALELAGEVLEGPVCTSSSPPPTSAPGGRGAKRASPAFVELLPALPAGPSPCTIELADPSGRKLTLSVRGAPGPELVALAQALWRGLR